MTEIFDLFGDPVPANWGQPGRPEHIPTQQNRNRVSMLVALGWSNKRIAAAIYVTLPTLRKHYFSELKFREVARDRLRVGIATKLWDMFQSGNVAAGKQFREVLKENDLMTYGQTSAPVEQREGGAKKSATQLVGKKEAARTAAQNPDQGTTLGALMAQRQQAEKPN